MKRPSKWGWFWLAWIAAFVVLDVVAGSQSLSRTLGRLLPKLWRRVLLVGLMAILTIHFWTQPDQRPDPCAWGCV